MNSLLISVLLAASALAAPQNTNWAPAKDTKSVCDDKFPQSLSFNVGPPKETVLPAVCKDLQCPGEVCVQTIDYTLNQVHNTTQSTNVLDHDGNKVGDKYSAWFTVYPPSNPSTPVTWTKDDCYGYFDKLIGDCSGSPGVMVGNLTIGGDTGLAGAVVSITIASNNGTKPSTP